MSRRKKKEAAAPVTPQETPAPANGTPLFPDVPAPAAAAPVRTPPQPPSPPSMDTVKQQAIEWATKCGLRPPFAVNGPEKVDYPQWGHGYVVHLQETLPTNGRCRMGTARFTWDGTPSYWSVDGGPVG